MPQEEEVMSLRQAAQQALEALEKVKTDADKQPPVYPWDIWRMWVDRAITNLRAALAEPEQKPSGSFVLWDNTLCNPLADARSMAHSAWHDGYASAKAERKPLTDEEISVLWEGHIVPVFGKTGINPVVFARAIERAHGIGGEG